MVTHNRFHCNKATHSQFPLHIASVCGGGILCIVDIRACLWYRVNILQNNFFVEY